MRIREAAALLGKGLVAGAAGTGVMTLVQTVEGRVRGRDPSTAPADAVEKLTGMEPDTQKGERRLNNVAHFAYGTAWGVPRALLGLTPLPATAATLVHFAAVQGTGLVMLPALDVAPRPTDWGATELAVDALHHLVYAVTVGLVFELLHRRR